MYKRQILGERSFVRVKEKQRKKFHWWYIPLGIVLVLVLTAGGLVPVSYTHLVFGGPLACAAAESGGAMCSGDKTA